MLTAIVLLLTVFGLAPRAQSLCELDARTWRDLGLEPPGGAASLGSAFEHAHRWA